jgi:hypothetical protein
LTPKAFIEKWKASTISERCPFGNGRTAHIRVNAELIAASEKRIIVKALSQSGILQLLEAEEQGLWLSLPIPTSFKETWSDL